MDPDIPDITRQSNNHNNNSKNDTTTTKQQQCDQKGKTNCKQEKSFDLLFVLCILG